MNVFPVPNSARTKSSFIEGFVVVVEVDGLVVTGGLVASVWKQLKCSHGQPSKNYFTVRIIIYMFLENFKKY